MSLQQSPYSLKIDEKIFRKTKRLAEKDRRTINMEIEFILDGYISDYEKNNGYLLDEDREQDNSLPF